MPENERVIEEALSLPADVRIALVDKLLGSLNLPTDEDINRLWAQEAEKRVSEIDRGKAKLVPGETLFAPIGKN